MQKSCFKVLVKNIVTYILSSLMLVLTIYLINKVNNGGLSLIVATAPILILNILMFVMSIGNVFGFIYVIKSNNKVLKITGIIMLILTMVYIITISIYLIKFLIKLGVF